MHNFQAQALNELEVHKVSCWRGDKCLLQQMSFTLRSGDMAQLEGVNGAGKTSLMRIIAGLARPENGAVLWNQDSIHDHTAPYHENLLYIGHKLGLKDVLSAYENLAFYQASFAKPNRQSILDALEKTGLGEHTDSYIKHLSAGQQRRVALARLYLTPACVWLLDEPFTAIDKHGVAQLIDLFKQHAQNGGIILFTSHQHIDDDSIKRITL